MYRIRMKRVREVLRAAVLEAVAQDLTIEDTDKVDAIVIAKLAALDNDRSTDAARAAAVEKVYARLHEVNRVATSAVRHAMKHSYVLDERTARAAITDEAEQEEIELDEEFQRATQARAIRLYKEGMKG